MWKREQTLGLRTPERPYGTVAVSIIHDGETIPEELKICERFEIIEFFNPMMREDSPARESFFTQMRACATGLAQMIENVPPYDESWERNAADEFYETFFSRGAPRQSTQPRFTQ